jgi:cytosine deaminase
MDFDLLLREVRLPGMRAEEPATDIGVTGGRIVAIARGLPGSAQEEVVCGNKLTCAGFVETHIHLDKSCILGRCACEPSRDRPQPMERVSDVKHGFTVQDVTARAAATLEMCILHGCTRMRTHAEVDPKVGLRGFEGVRALVERYRWAIDIEICVMPQEGLTNNPGTEELMIEALKSGATVVGAAPNYDTDRPAQIRRVFEMAREFDLDIDMHLDSGTSAAELDTLLVCELADKYGWGGRVAVGHVTKLSTMKPVEMLRVARRMADAGVALTVLPATDLYIGGRHRDHDVPRAVVDANALAEVGVTCSLSTNNVQNPFTPFGDGQLIRQANLYANIVQRGADEELRAVWDMITTASARIMRQKEYGIAVGAPADLVVVDAADEVAVLRGITPVLAAFKRGRRTVTRKPAVLHRPADPD